MNFSPIAVVNTTAMTDSATGSSLAESSDGSQLSEFTALLSDSLAQQQQPNDGQHAGPELTAQQQLQLALRSMGQELPLTGESLPPGKLTDAELQPLTALPLSTNPAEAPLLLPASMAAPVEAHGTISVNINAATAATPTAATGAEQGVVLKGDNAVIGNAMTPTAAAANQQAAQVSTIVDENSATLQQTPAIARAAAAIAQTGLTVEEQEAVIPAQVLNQRNPVTALNQQPLTPMQQGSSIPMHGGSGEQALHGQSETTPLTLLPEARVASSENSADFSRMIEKGLAQLNRDMSPSVHVPLSEPASRTSLDGMKLSTENLLLQQPIDKPKWGQEFGNRMVWMTKEGIQNAQLRLTPAHLGTIEVKISIQNDQANVSFMSQHGAVRDVIESTLPRLREMMQEAGVKLEQANVSGGETNTNAQQRHADKSPAQLGQSNHAAVSDDEEIDATNAAPLMHEGSLSAVDYYA